MKSLLRWCMALGVAAAPVILTACSDNAPTSPQFASARTYMVGCGGGNQLAAPNNQNSRSGSSQFNTSVGECCEDGGNQLAAGGSTQNSSSEYCNGPECRDGGWIGNPDCDPWDCNNWIGGCPGGGGGGGGGTPPDSVSYAEVVAYTDSVYAEVQAMSDFWDGGLIAVRAEADMTMVGSTASMVIPTPDNIVDLLVVLYDLGEIAIAGPNAERLRGLALDAAATLIPGIPAPRILNAGQKVTRTVFNNLKAWHAAARIGRQQHSILSATLRAQGHIGAARVSLVNGGIGYIDGAIIDQANKVIRIIELKPGNGRADALGLAQLTKYKAALESMQTWSTNGRVIPIRDWLQNQGWRIETALQHY